MSPLAERESGRHGEAVRTGGGGTERGSYGVVKTGFAPAVLPGRRRKRRRHGGVGLRFQRKKSFFERETEKNRKKSFFGFEIALAVLYVKQVVRKYCCFLPFCKL